jgi:tRNA A37 threonylcarbamoyladenosine dehydratase
MTQHIGFRCPDDLAEAIQALTVRGKDKTAVIVELLRYAISNAPVEQYETPVQQIEQIQELIDSKMAYLADGMNEVKQSLEAEIEALKTKFEVLETRLGEY